MTAAVHRPAGTARRNRAIAALAVVGPGLLVMLADTDVGSLITAAQSGAQWGYSLLTAQLVLIPILFVVQELTIRLGVFTGRGHGELIRDHFGQGWAWLSVTTLVIACAGAIVSEMSGIAGVAAIWGIPEPAATVAVAIFLIVMVVTGSYRRVERVAIAIGLFELVFLITMVLSDPSPDQIASGMVDLPLGDPDYLFLVSANIGAVIMPWMIFYQQSAVVDKGLTPSDLRASRWDTAVGSVVTQVVMIGMLVTCAATLWATGEKAVDLETVEQISTAITPHLGETGGRILFSLGMVGAALVAAIVASLTAAWGLGELTGYRRSIENTPREAPWFYAVFVGVLAVGIAVVASGANIVDLNVGIQVMNSLLLPIVLGFLIALARSALPPDHRLRGWYGAVVIVVAVAVCLLAVYSGIVGAISQLTG